MVYRKEFDVVRERSACPISCPAYRHKKIWALAYGGQNSDFLLEAK